MLRTARIARAWTVITRRPYSSRPSPSPAGLVAVDEDCIPLRATYSIADYLPKSPPSLSRDTLLKLHRLAALEPPASEHAWRDLQDLDELVAIVQAVRDVDTSVLGLEPGAMVDARVRAEPEPIDWSTSSMRPAERDEPRLDSRELLKLAQRTEGAYYVAPMPENVRPRKRSVSGSEPEAPSPDEL
ncbi:hypothetical protein JCM8202_003342 [Rhodotorula sphaerocarpa]